MHLVEDMLESLDFHLFLASDTSGVTGSEHWTVGPSQLWDQGWDLDNRKSNRRFQAVCVVDGYGRGPR